MSDIVAFRIGANPPDRLDKALARDVPENVHLSRTRLVRLITEGAVRVDGAVAQTVKASVSEGTLVEIALEAATAVDTLPETIPLTVVFEDDHLLVIDKPAGMVVHPAPGSPRGTLVNALLAYCGENISGVGGQKRPGIVHRIDKDTSGLLVVAKSDAAHHGLAAQFAAHSVHRLYVALCHGIPNAADPRLRGVRGVSFEQNGVLKITSQIARHKTHRQRQAVVFANGRHAVTRVKVLETFGNVALIECWLETGRTHQIRVHMAHVGHGLIGDPLYGGSRKLPKNDLTADAVQRFPRQALHAAELGFQHPVDGNALHFKSALHDDMATLVNVLNGSD